jgi:hypothetical protein
VLGPHTYSKSVTPKEVKRLEAAWAYDRRLTGWSRFEQVATPTPLKTLMFGDFMWEIMMQLKAAQASMLINYYITSSKMCVSNTHQPWVHDSNVLCKLIWRPAWLMWRHASPPCLRSIDWWRHFGSVPSNTPNHNSAIMPTMISGYFELTYSMPITLRYSTVSSGLRLTFESDRIIIVIYGGIPGVRTPRLFELLGSEYLWTPSLFEYSVVNKVLLCEYTIFLQQQKCWNYEFVLDFVEILSF